KGHPSFAQRTLIRPPSSRLGPLTPDERKALMASSPVAGKYDEEVDRDSAYEMIKEKRVGSATANGAAGEDGEYTRHGEVRIPKHPDAKPAPENKRRQGGGSSRQTPTEAFMKSLLRSL